MTSSRLSTVLIVLALGMQSLILFRLYRGPAPVRPSPVRAAPSQSLLDITALPAEGGADAKVILIEFSDYECPFCARYATETRRDLKKEYFDKGIVRHVFVNNPLAIHSAAPLLAAAAVCAGKQGKYWAVYEKLFERKPRTRDEVLEVAKEAALNIGSLISCLDSPEPQERIMSDTAVAKRLGLTSTPSFALGRTDRTGVVTLETFVIGAQPLDIFRGALQELLTRS